MAQSDDPRAVYASSEHRRSQTPRNLVGAVVICLGVALVLAFFLPRNDTPATTATVDFTAIGAQAQRSTATTLAIPELPTGWSANDARWQAASDGPAVWYVSYRTESGGQISAKQAINADNTWLYSAMGNRKPTATLALGSTHWDVYGQSPTDSGIRYGLAATVPVTTQPGAASASASASTSAPTSTGTTSLALYGSATDAEFAQLADAIVASLAQPGASR